jgi:hypothetical protein
MDMRNAIALFLLTTSLSAAPRLLSPERPVGDATPRANMAAALVDVATSPDAIVAAWSDGRSGSHRDIFATHLDDQGQPLDPLGIRIGHSLVDKQLLRVIWDDDRFVFLWRGGGGFWVSQMNGAEKQLLFDDGQMTVDYAPGLLLFDSRGRIVIQQLDRDFNVISLHTLDEQGTGARFVRSGNTQLVVWVHDFGGGIFTLMAQRIDGGIVSGLPAQITNVSSAYAQIVVGTSPDRSLLAYTDAGQVHVLDVRANGAMIPLATDDAPSIDSIAPAADGGFVIAVNGQLRRFDASGRLIDQVTRPNVIFPQLTSGHGTVIGVGIGVGQGPVSYTFASPETRVLSSIPPVQTLPRLASDGTNALMVWSEPPYVLAQLISGSGQPLHDAVQLPSLAPDEVPAVGFDGRTYVVIRTLPQIGHTDVTALRIARDGTIDGDVFLVGQSQGTISDVVTAGNVVAWHDTAYTLPHMVWTTLEQRAPIPAFPANDIAIAANGPNVMIAAAGPSPCGVEVSPVGGLDTFAVYDCAEEVAIAAHGDRWLIVYSDGAQLFAHFIRNDGSPIGERLLIADGATAPRVAWDGDEFAVTYQWGPFVEVATVREGDVERQLISFGIGPQVNGDVTFVNGAALLTYSRIDDKTQTSRIFTRTLSRPRVRPVR